MSQNGAGGKPLMAANRLITRLLMATALGLSVNAHATPVTFTVAGSGANTGLDASASFDISGGQLVVTLTNDSLNDITNPAQILEAMFFDIRSDVNLSLVSAVVAGGSDMCDFDNANPCVPAGGTDVLASDVYGGWQYLDDMGTTINGATRGVGAAGLNIFGSGTDGMAYGILSTGDNPNTYNGGMKNGSPFEKDSVQFTYNMSGSGAGSVSTAGDLSISNVSFNYGTALNTISVPVPNSAALVGLGIALVAVARRRRRYSTAR
jgi:hypothetical protein